jgi:hypothetical protein
MRRLDLDLLSSYHEPPLADESSHHSLQQPQLDIQYAIYALSLMSHPPSHVMYFPFVLIRSQSQSPDTTKCDSSGRHQDGTHQHRHPNHKCRNQLQTTRRRILGAKSFSSFSTSDPSSPSQLSCSNNASYLATSSSFTTGLSVAHATGFSSKSYKYTMIKSKNTSLLCNRHTRD